MRANSLQSNGIEVVHTVGRIQGSGPETMEVPRTDGFIMVVQQTDYQKHTIWRSGRLFHEGSHPAGSVTVIDTSESWSCRPQCKRCLPRTFTKRDGQFRRFPLQH
ncbi:Hypothetical protein AT6N2_L0923 [Agrobacterium tumefaciens]|nr:Hypothetical protein AT6N2_L0923 [Agrobacterium tumefaciens]